MVFFGDSADFDEFIGGRHAAVDARNHGEGAILLDIAVQAVVDEPAIAFVDIIFSPDGAEQDREAHFGFFIFFYGERFDHLRDGAEVAAFHFGGQRGLIHGDGGDIPGLAGIGFHLAGNGLNQAFDELLATAAAGAGAGGFADGQDGGFAGFDGLSTILPLQTPLQSQTCLSSGIAERENSVELSVIVPNSKSARRLGAGRLPRIRATRSSYASVSPTSMAPASLPLRMMNFL